jgi:SNF2 family DNA or RNA helicase
MRACLDYIDGYFALKISEDNLLSKPLQVLRLSNRFNHLYNSSPSGLRIKHLDKRLADCNSSNILIINSDIAPFCDISQAARRQLGRSPEEIDTFGALDRLANFKSRLLPHQVPLAKRLLKNKRCLLDWEMGLGKTVLALWALTAWLERQEIDQGLIIVPASLRETVWGEELARHVRLPYVLATGSRERRERAYALRRPLTVVSYQGVLRDLALLKRPSGRRAFVLDESSALKNARTRTHESLRELAPQPTHGLLLNGTPIENHEAELRAQLSWLFPEEVDWTLFDVISGYPVRATREAALKSFLKPFMVSLGQADVTGIEKPKTEIVKLVLSGDQKRAYEALESEWLGEIKNKSDAALLENLRSKNTLARWVRLQQVLDHPALLGLSGGSVKLDFLGRFHEKLSQEGKKALYFTQYKTFAELLARELSDVVLFVGGLPEREENYRRFRREPGLAALIITTAGARGLNLPDLDYVVFLDCLFNPAIHEQIIGRGRRITRSKPPLKPLMLVVENTLEVLKQDILNKKIEKQRFYKNLTQQQAEQITLECLKQFLKERTQSP